MTLQERLDAHKADFRAKVPVEVVQIMQRATRDLEDSGLAGKALGPGDRFPDFELPSHRGTSVRSQDLLAHGPLVATVYRGVW